MFCPETRGGFFVNIYNCRNPFSPAPPTPGELWGRRRSRLYGRVSPNTAISTGKLTFICTRKTHRPGTRPSCVPQNILLRSTRPTTVARRTSPPPPHSDAPGDGGGGGETPNFPISHVPVAAPAPRCVTHDGGETPKRRYTDDGTRKTETDSTGHVPAPNGNKHATRRTIHAGYATWCSRRDPWLTADVARPASRSPTGRSDGGGGGGGEQRSRRQTRNRPENVLPSVAFSRENHSEPGGKRNGHNGHRARLGRFPRGGPNRLNRCETFEYRFFSPSARNHFQRSL